MQRHLIDGHLSSSTTKQKSPRWDESAKGVTEQLSLIKTQNHGIMGLPKKKKKKKPKYTQGIRIVQRMKGMKLCTGIRNASFNISQDDKRHTRKYRGHGRMMRFLLVRVIYPRHNGNVTRWSLQKQKVVKIIASSGMIQ